MPAEAPPTHVSTNRVAAALGVSVSTVKRWVDEGVLPARKTAGGHRKLATADVLEFSRRANLPHVDVAQLASAGRGRRPAAGPVLAQALRAALVRGDRDAARAVLFGAYWAGVAVEALADEVVAPAMREIGREWEHGRLGVMHEHRGTQVCSAVLYELMAVLDVRAATDRPVAVGGSPDRDPYSLANLLAQMVLVDAGWRAVDLGPNTPITSFEAALAELRPRLVWISVSHLDDGRDFVAKYRAFYDRAAKAGVAVAVGGRGLDEAVRSQIPYTAFGDGLANLAALARTLHARPRPPRRGRPKK